MLLDQLVRILQLIHPRQLFMEIRQPIRTIQDFLLSTYFADGLRITFGILLPSLLCAQFGELHTGMTLSLGALCVSIVDSPGPISHRRNAMIITTILITILSILTGLTNRNTYFILALIAASTFIFSMFYIYGIRAASIGTASLLIIIIGIDDVRPWQKVLEHGFYIMIGSLWYTALSYTVYRLRPYWMVQQALSESIAEVSNFLREKAKFYNKNLNYDKTYADLLKIQVSVHEKQDAVRELLFKTKEIVKDSTPEGRFLLLVFVDMVDLFEQVMSTYYNYKQLHEQFDDFGILSDFEMSIKRISYALDDIAFALKRGNKPVISKRLLIEIEKLRNKINQLEHSSNIHKVNALSLIALKNIEVNIENILSRVETIFSYFKTRENNEKTNEKYEIDKFISKQTIDFKRFTENLTFKSSTFKHSIRVTIVMIIGYVIAQFLNSSISYWILLTILVISKPGYTLTKQRNYERIIGTIVGAIVGTAILSFVTDRNTLFVILMVCMVGCYSFQRKNYVVSVLFMTPYILINFSFLGMGSIDIAKERIIDTLIGSTIALLASYSLFPNWERDKLNTAMKNTIMANKAYFDLVTLMYFDKNYNKNTYKLARKEVYVSSANLASLFQRMLSEPKSKQLFIQEVHQFTTLNHLLSSYIATLTLYYQEHDFKLKSFEDLKPIAHNTSTLLESAHQNLSNNNPVLDTINLVRVKTSENESLSGEAMVPEQFKLIQKVAYDLYKLSLVIKS